jgi:uncharacterized membrane-anchored protein
MGLMHILIIAAGIVGLCVFVYALFELIADAGRRHQPVDIVIAVVVAVLTVWALLAFGDHLLR